MVAHLLRCVKMNGNTRKCREISEYSRHINARGRINSKESDSKYYPDFLNTK